MTSSKSAAFVSQFSPLSLARMVWKQKIYLVLIWLVVSAIAVIIVHGLPAYYRAETLILVDSQKIPERYVSSTVSTDLQDRLATISQQILSVTRLRKIIDDFDLYKEARKTKVPEEIIELMRNDIDIKLERAWTGGRPGAFRIAYQGMSPTIVSEVANRLASLYIEENLRVREAQAEGTSEFIQTQLVEAKKKLDEMEAAVTKYKLEHNGDLPQQEGFLSGTLDRLQAQLQGSQDAINRAQQTKVLLENSLHIAESELAALTRPPQPVAAAGEDGTINVATDVKPPRYQKKSELLQAQLEIMRMRYSDDHPDIKRLRTDIAKVKAIEEKEEKDRQANATTTAAAPPKQVKPKAQPVTVVSPETAREIAHLQEQVQTLNTQLALTNKEIESHNAERQQILQSMPSFQRRLEQIPVREQEMAALSRDYEMTKTNYRSLLDKQTSAEMATDMERRQKSERFTVLDPAQPPQKPFKPKRGVLYGMGTFVGLALGLVFCLGREIQRSTFLGEWELPQGVPVLGRIPQMEFVIPEGPAGPEADSEGKHKFGKLRLAVVSSALLSVLATIAAGVYYFILKRS